MKLNFGSRYKSTVKAFIAIITTSLLSLMLSSSLHGQEISVEAWNLADDETTRLQPSDFTFLPVPVREELERRNCTIPQVYADDAPGNVITGHFFSENQMDIAVLCSHNKISSILVFRNGEAISVEELASAVDRGYLQDIGSGQIGYSRNLQVAEPQSIQRYYEAFDEPGPEPSPLSHDGIEDTFVGKASTIKYWHEDQWLELQGAD
jgi:hypothetical protein